MAGDRLGALEGGGEGGRDVLERPYTVGGGGGAPLDPFPPPSSPSNVGD